MAMNSNITSTRVPVILGSKVDGTLPAPLVLVISNAQWKAFVDEVDKVSVEAGLVIGVVQAWITLIVLGLMIYFIRFIITRTAAYDTAADDTAAYDFPTGILLLVVGLGLGLGLFTVLVLLVTVFLLHFPKKWAFGKLQAIAERSTSALLLSPSPNNNSSSSNSNSNISVHFRQGTYPYSYHGECIAGSSYLYCFEFIHCVITKPTMANINNMISQKEYSSTVEYGTSTV
jgi:hypothetical protein